MTKLLQTPLHWQLITKSAQASVHDGVFVADGLEHNCDLCG